MTRPRLRTDGRCWASCGRFAAPLDLSAIDEVYRSKLKAHPRACWAHRESVEAELEAQIARWLARQEADR